MNTTNIVYGAIILWGAYIAFNNVNNIQSQRRKAKKQFTPNHIDHQLDAFNRSTGRIKNAHNNAPHYSRHNVNRRRRPPIANLL